MSKHWGHVLSSVLVLLWFCGVNLDASGPAWEVEQMTPKEIASYLDASVLAGQWYMNNQNTDEHPWGGIHDSADLGRFIYEYYPTRQWARGNGVWGQAVGIMGLLALHFRTGRDEYLEAAKMAGEYLKSLQILDCRDFRNFGGLREHNPQDRWSFPRDAATGGIGFAALYRATGDEEYLYRLKIHCEWFLRYAMGEEKWPHYRYWFDDRENPDKTKGPWQVGAGLMFYYAYKLTGETHYIDEGLLPLCDQLIIEPVPQGLERPWGTNDDFASIAVLAAYEATGQTKYLEAVRAHADWLLSVQQEDGSYPGFSAAVYVASNVMLELCRVIENRNLNVQTEPYLKSVRRAVQFGRTLQERTSRDVRAYGGFYGQTDFGLNRDRIHHRVTGYSIIFNLKYEGRTEVPYYSVFGWD